MSASQHKPRHQQIGMWCAHLIFGTGLSPSVGQFQPLNLAARCADMMYMATPRHLMQNAPIYPHPTEKEGAPMGRAIELAGFFVAHGIWCLAEGEPLTPMRGPIYTDFGVAKVLAGVPS